MRERIEKAIEKANAQLCAAGYIVIAIIEKY